MGFTSVGDGLSGVVRSWAEDPEMRWGLIERAWRGAAGEAVGDRAIATSFDQGVLIIRVRDPRWLPTLRDLETDLLRAIRVRPGGELVAAIEWTTTEVDPTEAKR